VDDDLMTPQELATRWKIKPKTLDNWRSARVGPPHMKIGGSVRYSEKAVAEWLLEQQRDRAVG
jgi:predicted DNA-binding transcriptional regulator AlpA